VSNQDSTPKDDPARPTARFVTVSEDHDGQRVDNFLRTELKGAPKTLVYRILRTGEVRINKGRAKPDTRVHTGDVVRIPPLRLAEAMPVRVGEGLRELLDDVVIHEDEHLLILNKPAGLAVHAGSGIQVGLIEALRELRPELSGLELAHRLDRETSGVIALAKDRKTLLALHEFFAGDEVHKKYLAFVQGDVRASLRMIDAPLEKSTLRGGERMVEVRGEGKPSQTRIRVRTRYEEGTLIEAEPVTGRTHQIRVHCTHVGHPLAFDDKYGDADFNRSLRPLGLSRLFLHAAELRLPASFGGKRVFEARLPAELSAFLQKLHKLPS
jgi:23S rRNA pseudouridine955/2504/2580 synthase